MGGVDDRLDLAYAKGELQAFVSENAAGSVGSDGQGCPLVELVEQHEVVVAQLPSSILDRLALERVVQQGQESLAHRDRVDV